MLLEKYHLKICRKSSNINFNYFVRRVSIVAKRAYQLRHVSPRVHPSVRIHQLDSHWLYFREFRIGYSMKFCI